MIKIVELGMRFFDKKLFENVNLNLKKGHTYGIIGPNGVGKSTFLKIVANKMSSTTGSVIIDPKKRISILDQNQNLHPNLSATTVVIMGNKHLHDIDQEKTRIYENANATEGDYEKVAQLEEIFGAMGGWNAENDAQTLLAGLGLAKERATSLMKDLKSNEKVKVLLAKALFGNPDVLILDEPTNNLDLKAIKWLQKFLVEYKNLVLVVSHDPAFLDEVCTNIIDIDFGDAKMFTGNYSFWKESSQLALELQKKQNAKKGDQIKKLQDFIDRFSANASKSSQATSRKKALEKISIKEIRPSSRKYPYIKFVTHRDPGKSVLKVENLSYVAKNGKILFENLNFSIHKNEKIALIGEDDIAKTRLLEILLGHTNPTTGKVVWGPTIKSDYFPHDNNVFFASDKTILEWISDWPLKNVEPVNKDNSDSRIRSFLGRMFFSNDSVFKKVKNCSGGEKARLMYAKMMLTESNFLVFNQPLDHLDTESIDSVIKGIANYQSSCIFVTYNRGLINKANVIFELGEKTFTFFRGTLNEYEEHLGY